MATRRLLSVKEVLRRIDDEDEESDVEFDGYIDEESEHDEETENNEEEHRVDEQSVVAEEIGNEEHENGSEQCEVDIEDEDEEMETDYVANGKPNRYHTIYQSFTLAGAHLQMWETLMTDDTVDNIVIQTCLYAQQYASTLPPFTNPSMVSGAIHR